MGLWIFCILWYKWVVKGTSTRGQGIAGNQTGCLRDPKPHHKAPASYPAPCLTTFLAGLRGFFESIRWHGDVL